VRFAIGTCRRSIGSSPTARCESSKPVRSKQRRRVTVGEKDGQRSKRKTAATQESSNFYATNFELGSVSPLFIHQFSRSRWQIDTEVFQTITTDCHLKHPLSTKRPP
jgi:hypothetical protein